MEEKLLNPRTRPTTKQTLTKKLESFNTSFSMFPNGFVIFQEGYLKKIYEIVEDKLTSLSAGDTINYDEFLDY